MKTLSKQLDLAIALAKPVQVMFDNGERITMVVVSRDRRHFEGRYGSLNTTEVKQLDQLGKFDRHIVEAINLDP